MVSVMMNEHNVPSVLDQRQTNSRQKVKDLL